MIRGWTLGGENVGAAPARPGNTPGARVSASP